MRTEAASMMLSFIEQNLIGLIHSSGKHYSPKIKNKNYLVANFITQIHKSNHTLFVRIISNEKISTWRKRSSANRA